MAGKVCPQCGAPVEPGAFKCKYCGMKMEVQQRQVQNRSVVDAGSERHYVNEAQAAPLRAQQPSEMYPHNPQYPQPMQGQAARTAQGAYYPQAQMTAISPAWPIKSKVVAAILAIFLGGLGIHKFYLGKIGAGILYLLFCWTGIPAIIAFIEGLVYLFGNEENFQLKHHVRLK